MLAEMDIDAGDDDLDDMIARLAERLGITGEGESSSEDAAEVHIDLFGKKKTEVA